MPNKKDDNLDILKLKPGTTLRSESSIYTIKEVLGSGGFGITYRATMQGWKQGKLGRIPIRQDVALKELFAVEHCMRGTGAHSSDVVVVPGIDWEDYRKRFIKEAHRMSLLGAHPNIVKVLEVFEANNTAYIVMELVEGMSLHEYVKKHGPLAEEEAVGCIGQVALALRYTHDSKKIMHLDIKPGNILRRATDGSIVVIDFGLAKEYNDDGKAMTASHSTGLT
ncbi:MAG: serine/threonine protein kinase, partial [Mediterranea sp.]|nr:serine/threonine protein kinase [Mediterranea sp.]